MQIIRYAPESSRTLISSTPLPIEGIGLKSSGCCHAVPCLFDNQHPCERLLEILGDASVSHRETAPASRLEYISMDILCRQRTRSFERIIGEIGRKCALLSQHVFPSRRGGRRGCSRNMLCGAQGRTANRVRKSHKGAHQVFHLQNPLARMGHSR